MAVSATTVPEPDLKVRSGDGTSIGVFVQGQGPPLVLVHGSLQDHSISAALVDELAARFTCHAMDRRGFGASDDADTYAIESEFDDVAAVVDHIAATTGEAVHLWGHSYGASCAMGGAARTTNIGRLVLYEPSLGLKYPPGVIETIEEAVANGDNDTAIVTVLSVLLEMTDADIDTMRATPEWPRRLAVAHTVARECRAEQGWAYQPGDFDAVTVPTLLLSGSDSPEDLESATAAAATAIPQARIQVLHGHAHIAHRTNPSEIAAIVTDFLDPR